MKAISKYGAKASESVVYLLKVSPASKPAVNRHEAAIEQICMR
jgi:hypothetical protein